MRYLTLTFILLSNFIFAQYDSTMYDLIKTTYERKFDKTVISSYLKSESDKKIKAALLSIAQSEDTSFIPVLLNLDFNLYGNEILFAIGQIGSSSQSIQFLWKHLLSSPPIKHYPNIFIAIGKIGDENDLNRLIDYYESTKEDNFNINGISEAILQFQLRGIKNERAKEILINEILVDHKDLNRKAIALFTLARYGSSEKVINKLIDILVIPMDTKSQFSEIADSLDRLVIELKQYALLNFQVLKYFPSDDYGKHRISKKYYFLTELSVNEDILFKINLAKAIIYLDLEKKNTNYLTTILELLDESNLNVALQIANSVTNIDSSSLSKSKNFIKRRFNEIFYDFRKNNKLKSEWLLSCYKILGNYKEFSRLASRLDSDKSLNIKFAALNPDTLQAIASLTRIFKSNLAKSKIESLTHLLKFLPDKKYSDLIITSVFDALSSSNAPLISISADGIDSASIIKHKEKLKDIISNQIIVFRDNPEFIESIISLINLSEKIDQDFFKEMIWKANFSSLYSVRKFISSKMDLVNPGLKELDKFDEIWEYAFKYTGANIYTSQGSFTIKFRWDVAPITAANFCKLASNQFYDGIIFHRVVPGFVIQAGDPTQTGWGGPGYDIVSEFSDLKYDIGKVGMASAGKDTEGSQFFVMQGNYPHLNRRYSLFANVTVGLRTVYDITQDDKIISIQLIK